MSKIINNICLFEDENLQVFAEKIDCNITLILKYYNTTVYTKHLFINEELKPEENVFVFYEELYLDFFKKIVPSIKKIKVSFFKRDKRFESNNSFYAEQLSHKIINSLIDFNFFN